MRAEFGFYVALTYSLISLISSYAVDVKLGVQEHAEANSEQSKGEEDERAVLITTESKHAK